MENKSLFLMSERVKTFKNWPFSDKNMCNVSNMAGAGFYSIATGEKDADSAKCFLCGKELDGWEASDDPWVEHKSHAPKCAFVQLGKTENELMLSEFLSIVQQCMLNETKNAAELVKDEIDSLGNKVKRKHFAKK